MSKLTWIHLSDLHFGGNDVGSYEQGYIINKLAEDILALINEHNLHIDFIFFTGDIVFRGDAESYKRAHEYLKLLARSANISENNIIIVPGNHDVARSPVLDAVTMPKDNKAVSELIGNKTELELYASGLQSFREFTQQISGFNRYDDNDLYYVVNQKINDITVSILALNTAWLANKNIRQGEVVLGERQVRDALKRVEDADIIIALMHHPFSWLA